MLFTANLPENEFESLLMAVKAVEVLYFVDYEFAKISKEDFDHLNETVTQQCPEGDLEKVDVILSDTNLQAIDKVIEAVFYHPKMVLILNTFELSIEAKESFLIDLEDLERRLKKVKPLKIQA